MKWLRAFISRFSFCVVRSNLEQHPSTASMDCFTPMSQLLADVQAYAEGILYPLLSESSNDSKLWQRGLGDIAVWPDSILDAEAKVFRELDSDIDGLLAEIVANPPELKVLIHKFITELSKSQAIKKREYFDRFGQHDRLAVIQSAMTRTFRQMKLKPTASAKAPRTCPTMCSQAIVPTDSVSCVPRMDVHTTTAASFKETPATIPEAEPLREIDLAPRKPAKDPNQDILSFATLRTLKQEQAAASGVASAGAASETPKQQNNTMNISLVSRTPTLFSQRFPSLVPPPAEVSAEQKMGVSSISLARD